MTKKEEALHIAELTLINDLRTRSKIFENWLDAARSVIENDAAETDYYEILQKGVEDMRYYSVSEIQSLAIREHLLAMIQEIADTASFPDLSDQREPGTTNQPGTPLKPSANPGL